MTVIGFAVSILFIVFVCTRLICARIQLRTARRSFQTSSRSNLRTPWLSEWKRKEMLLQRLQMARILSNIPVSRGGPTSLVIYDIHGLQCWLKKQKDPLAPEKEDVGSKVMWTSGLVFGRGEVVCNKVREDDKRIVRIKEGNPAGCHVVIVDDLVQSGSTLIECQVMMLVKRSVYLLGVIGSCIEIIAYLHHLNAVWIVQL